MPQQLGPGRQALAIELASLRRAVDAQSRQQDRVIVDPTGASGDPAHGYAVVVMGNLLPITGIAAFGIASFKTGVWVQV